jgi:hypothetical protein|tara:strand:+ start:156 stop:776 length:621 start_codon:yes stop_codon:yes gene_type:complete
MSKYASGKHARAISDRSGMEFPWKEMVREWNGSLVHFSEFEPKQPQLEPKPYGGDGIALSQVRVARTEPITTVVISNNGFETYAAGSSIINVFSPGHGLTNGTTYLFRGPPTTSPGTGTTTNPVFAYATIPNFDGITGAQIGQGSGYAITTGKYVSNTGSGSPGRNTSDYSLSNFFHFTVNTDTATTGNIKGGGYGCSVGPITITP